MRKSILFYSVKQLRFYDTATHCGKGMQLSSGAEQNRFIMNFSKKLDNNAVQMSLTSESLTGKYNMDVFSVVFQFNSGQQIDQNS